MQTWILYWKWLDYETFFFIAFDDNIKFLNLWIQRTVALRWASIPQFSLGIQILQPGLLALEFKQWAVM
jgi:hypothetical protein